MTSHRYKLTLALQAELSRPGSSGRMDDILWKEGHCRVIEDMELSQKISEDA